MPAAAFSGHLQETAPGRGLRAGRVGEQKRAGLGGGGWWKVGRGGVGWGGRLVVKDRSGIVVVKLMFLLQVTCFSWQCP